MPTTKPLPFYRKQKDYADETIKNFHKFGKASISIKDMEQQRSKLREKIDSAQSKSQSKKIRQNRKRK